MSRYAGFSKRWRSYVCTDQQKRYVPIVKMHSEPLACREKLAKFCGELETSIIEVESLPAYILPDGSRKEDVPVEVAVSTTRKR
jgi:hypothetical protein